MKKVVIITSLFFFFFNQFSKAQTGPGGVGNSTSNILWLKASDLSSSLTDGAAVSSWTDASGNTIIGTQGTASRQPTYNQSQVHGQDVVTFDGTDGIDLSTLSNASSDYTAFAVTNNTGSAFIFDSQTGRLVYGHGSAAVYYDGAWKGASIATTGNIELLNWNVNSSGSLYIDGTQQQSALTYAPKAIGGASILGGSYNLSGSFLVGDIGDFIIYNTVLNGAERIVVENYLGAKYGITIANDFYAYDTNLSLGFMSGNEVAGIGRVDASNIHNSSFSAGILSINNASAMTDGEYLFFGHDNASITSWVTPEVPNSDANLQRLPREWRFDETGEVGTVDITIDVATFPALPANYDFYTLWTDADGDFSSGATQHILSDIGGGQFTASGVNITSGDYLAIMVVRPEIELASTTSNGLESLLSPAFTVNINYAVSSNVTVNYADAITGTATNAGTDYTFVDGTVSIIAGNTTANIAATTIINDGMAESDETIIFSISSPSNGQLGTNTTHTYTVNDNDNGRTIQFNTTSSSGLESVTPVTIVIDISSADALNPTSVDYTITGTATSGFDYTLASGTATIAASGGTTTSISLIILDDVIDDDNETVILTLSNPTNANLGTNTTYTYTITDNDAPPTVEFLTTTSFGSENTSPVSIAVVLSQVSGQDITVDYSDALTGTATNGGTDYSLSNSTLTILAGNLSATFDILINDESIEESPETINLTISNPIGATLGANTAHTFTIGDDDNNGFTGPGGVGNSTNNIIWLRADDLASSLTDGAAVSSWIDNSGNAITGTQGAALRQPTYNQAKINNRDMVTFDGSDLIDISTLTNAASNYTGFAVTNNTAATFIFDTQIGRTVFGHQYSSGAYFEDAWRGTQITTSGTVMLNWVLNTGGGEVYVDGTQTQSALPYAANAISGTSVIGAGYTASGAFANGDIGDFIIYNTLLNTAERQIVENYLGSKYGITIANDYFAYDTNVPGSTYGGDVAGIGRVDVSNLHKQTQSAAMLGFNNANAMGNGEFLFLGHDDANQTSWTTTEVPDTDTNLQRIAREWRIDETGEVGTVNIELDITNLAALPANYTQYAIFIDTDGDFSSGATIYPMTLNGSLYIASGINLTDGDYMTIGIIRPVISFTSSTSSGSETLNTNIEISLNYAVTTNVTVDYARTSGTATSTVDFSLAPSTATILAGQTTTNIQVGVVNDTDIESAETIIVDISNPSGVILGSTTQHTFTIDDDDNGRKIEFTVASGSGAEATTPATVSVLINNLDGSNPTTVDYTVTGGTATGGGIDYTLASGTASVSAGSTTTSFDIVILNDLIDDDAETIVITLSNPINANLGTNQTYTFSIVDDDTAPTIEFVSTTSFGSESVASATISVLLSSTSGQDITVDFADALTGTATNLGTDYLLIDGSITIPAGSTSGNLTISINDDILEELPETVNLAISNPVGATLGTNTTHTFTISDNDNSGFTGPGSIGNSTNNILWLKADDLSSSLTNGAAVSSWLDNSGNSITGIQGSASLQPTYNQAKVYNRDMVTFDGGDLIDLSTLTNSASNYTAFAVTNNTASSFIFDTQSGRTVFAHQNSAGAYFEDAWRGTQISTTGTVLLEWILNTAGGEVYVDGTQTQSAQPYAANAIGGTSGLGAVYNATSNFVNGDIGDFIIYNTLLNTAERYIVENYLASKYGITIANDYFAYDTNIPGATYGGDVAGLGRVDASNLHIKSQSAAMLGFSNADGLGDGEFLFLGHDDANEAAWTTTEVPNADANLQRIAREWRISETGEVGNVDIELDITNLAALPADFTSYAILIDSDGDFSSGATVYQASLSGSVYVVAGINVTVGEYMTIGIIKPVVAFTSSTSAGLENTSSSVEISLNYALTSDITVDYAVIGGTATSGADYNFTSATATILAGQTTTTFLAGILNDTDIESDETIIYELSNPSGVILGANTQNTFTINDDDNGRKIEFTLTSGNGNEDITPVTVDIKINSADLFNSTSVDYAVTGGTATGGGTDYTLASGTATVPAGAGLTTSFDITIINDLLDDEAETIIITISNPTNSNLGVNQTYTYTINDNDAAPSIQFVATSSLGSESATSPAIIVQLSSISGQEVTIDYADALVGTATNGGTDYLFLDGTLTISAGNTTGAIPVTINDDSSIESPETFTINISNPTGATLGVNTSHLFTISDNDNDGYSGPGGVGNSSNNILWLKADDLAASLTDGAVVSSWADASGNSITGTQGNGSLQPTYNQAQINNRDVVTFDGSDAIDISTLTNAASNYTAFAVTNNTAGTFIFDTQTGRTVFAHQYASGAYFEDAWRGTQITTSGTVLLNWVLNTAGGEIYVDGTQTQSGLAYTANAIGGTSAIGASYPANSVFMNGDIGDFIIYNTLLNTAERYIVENYLASKYGITIANDYFAYDTNVPGSTYGGDVAGIGRVDASNLHNQTQSAKILGFNNADNLDNGEFLFLGHEDGDITAWTSTEVPSADVNLQRIAREWRVDETGVVGNVDIELDISSLPALPVGFTQYAIFVDADGDFSSGATIYQATLLSSLYVAGAINISDGDYLTVGIIKPVIAFTATTSNASETTNPNIEISINYKTTVDVTVDYARISGTATPTSDFIFAGGTATILAGQTTTNFQPGTLNDIVLESDETIVFEISNPSGITLGSNTQHTFSINDDDNSRKIYFLAATANGSEATSPVTVTVQINSADATNPTTVDYAVTGGTATGSGTDFTLASGTASVAAGIDLATTFDIIIINDLIDDDAETIIVSLSNPTNANLGVNQTYTFTINDDDSAPTVDFLVTSSFGGEAVASHTVDVTLSGVSGQDISVDYADALTGTATNSGIDYLLVDGTMTILAGNTTGSFNLTLNDDAVEENPETIIINLSNPVGATLGTNTSHTFTIGDDDNSGFTGPGGVGNSSNNILWLKADDLATSLTDGAAVSSWADASGNSITGTQGNGALQPTYNQAQIYNRDVVTFDGSDGIDLSTLTHSASNYSAFAVTNNTAATFIFDTQTGRTVFGHQYSSGAYYEDAWRGTQITTSGTVMLNWVLNTGGGEVYVDGTQTQSGLLYTANAIGGTSALGASYPVSNSYTNGDIGDFIIYNTVLNNAQRIIVENYLGSKYGLTIANDYFTYDTNIPGGTYGSDVAGIGRVDVSNTHKQAQSGGMLGFNNADGLADGEYLFLGHEDGDISAWTTTEVPDGDTNLQRVAREWRVDETGDVGNVSIELSTSNLPALPAGFTQYAIFVDADGDFSSGATVYQATLTGSLYVAPSINLTAGQYLAVGIIQPVISFTTSASNASEVNNPNIEISLNYPVTTNVTVDYARTGGTATDVADFNFSGGTATIVAGQTTVNFQPGIINDTAIEGDETLIFDISNPVGLALGSITQHTYTINDEDNSRKIDFTLTTGSGSEGSTPVTINIKLNSADAFNPTTVDYTVTGGTATGGGTDYTLVSGTASILAGGTTTSFDLTITEDLIDDEAETIIISLSNPTNANLGVNQTFTYTIIDNDASPIVEYVSTTSFGNEGTATVSVAVSLTTPSGQDITVDYADALTGTASPLGVDYLLIDGTLTILAGATSATFDVSINDDAIEESPETVIINLSNPIGATLGTAIHTLTIGDNDNTGSTGPGGVGNSSNNILWLKPEDLSSSLTDGAAVTSWADASGNNITGTQGSASLQPTYNQALINGQDVVTFDGSDAIDLSTLIQTASNYTAFSVTNNTAGTFIFDTQTGRTVFAHQYSSGAYYEDAWRGSQMTTSGTVLLNWILNTAGGEVYVDGAQTQSGLLYTANAIGGTSAMGASYPATSVYANGDFGDFIIYNTVLNAAQRIIVENYLGNKYGIAIANDYYAYETSHKSEIAGIGRFDVSNTHLGAQSGGILSLSNANGLADGEYLLFGHDNASHTAWTATEAPNGGSNTQRIAKEWRLDETGDVGLISIGVDITSLAALPAGYTDYVIWVDADGDFTSGATQYQTILVGSDYIASGVAVAAGDFVTIGIVKPVIQFTSATSNGSETVTNNIEISLSFALGTDVTVDYNITGGTASNGSVDYNLATSGTVTIFAGQTTANLNPGVINDTDIESDETIEITLSNPSASVSLGTNIVNTYAINDDDNLRNIQFSVSSSSGTEAATAVSLTVQINNLDASNPTTVDYAVTGGTATGSGTDYTLASGTASVSANTMSTTFDIVIVDDTSFESTETIIITLSNPSNANLGTNTEYTYSITDNDTAPTVQFASSTSLSLENAGTLLVEVTLSTVSGADITVDFVDAGTGTATSGGTDYSFTAGTLTFLAGSTSENISIPLIDDSIIETPETINLTISNPLGGATLGVITAHTATINDNDNNGVTGPGGVGDPTSNILWLRASDLSASLANGAAVTSWADNSGNTITGSQVTASRQPTYNQAIINGQDVVSFDGNDGIDISTLTHSASNYTAFAITNNSANSFFLDTQLGRMVFGHGATGAYYDGAWRGTPIATPGTAQLVNWYLNTAGGEAYIDGTQTQSALIYNANAIGGTTVLGGGYTYGGSFVLGDIGEFIIYNTVLNTAERIIIENYLGNKYGLTIANDFYAHQATHNEDLAGIGQVDASNLHTAAQSAGILQISNPSLLGNAEYLFFGHDNASIAAWTATETPSAGVQRIAREWRVDETGDVGTIQVNIDASTLPAFDASYSSYLLYVDADGDFTAGAVSYGLSLVSGNDYQALDVVIATGDYITIAEAQNVSMITGDFNNPATWTTGVVPGAGDDIIIAIGTTVTLTANQTVGSLTLNGTLDMSSFTLTLDAVGGTPLAVSGTLTLGTGTIEYAGAGAQCVAGINYNNLILSGSGVKTLCGNINVDGDLTVSSELNTDAGNNYNINLAGDWIATGTFTTNGETVTFDGTTAQDISGASSTFNNLTINKATGDVTLSAAVNVNTTLTMTTGDIILGTFDLTIGGSGSISGGSTTSYIQADNSGVVIKSLTGTPSTTNFAVGSSTGYSPFSFTLNSGALSSASVSMNLREAKHSGLGSITDYVGRYWSLTPTGITTPNYDVSYTYQDTDINGTESNFGPVKYNSFAEGGTASPAANSLAWGGITSFSDFTGNNSNAPLPIELLSFDVYIENESVVIDWKTASELNNDFFTIEKSKNGVDFDEVITIEGSGTSNKSLEYTYLDENPYQGISYYRLKQTDFDGQFEYFDAKRISINIQEPKNHFEIYPNPSNGNVIHLRSAVSYISGEEVIFRFSDLSGKLAYETILIADDNGMVESTIDAGDKLSSGVYIVTGISKHYISTLVYVVEK